MCWSGKCCFFVKLDVGCLLIGIFTLVLSLGISATSLTFICETSIGPNNKDYSYLHNRTEHLLGLVHLDVNPGSKQVVLGIILLVALILAMTSTFLIVGVQKRLSGLVLSYFAYGIFVTFFTILGSLLLLLKTSWWLALILIGLSCEYGSVFNYDSPSHFPAHLPAIAPSVPERRCDVTAAWCTAISTRLEDSK
ncbi:uncharacterized protein LOC114366391 [Ostrinia furnacalis]|uniref:uncharacterized protein LOC114366391 n=1 Tax=Ostrinia furnacalis TaxID=93504 RepID=UPI00103896DF|nr:uncharacterized protein LOC114366391 [Ostrinia furnacalis]